MKQQFRATIVDLSAAMPDGARYAYGRCSFDCASPETGGVLRLAVWQVGRVWLNGMVLGRLYVRSHENEWRYHEFDLTGKLQQGRNVVCVLVHAWGLPEEVIPGVPSPSPLRLMISGRTGDAGLADAARWRFAPALDFLPAPRHNSLIGHEELRDLRLTSSAWLQADFDDSAWQAGQAIETSPFNFLPAPHRPLREERHVPSRIVEQGHLIEAWAGVAKPLSPDPAWWRIKAASSPVGRTFFHSERLDSQFFVNSEDKHTPITPPMGWVSPFLPYFLESNCPYELRGWHSPSALPLTIGWDRNAAESDTRVEWAPTPEGPWTAGDIQPDVAHRLMIDGVEPQAKSRLEADGTLAWRVENEESMIVLEFPQSITMLPRLEFSDASAGVEVELIYSEHLSAVPGLRFPAVYRDRAILGAGPQTWEVALQYKSARYLGVIIRAPRGFACLRRVCALYRHYDYDETGAFESDDQRLNQIWRICRNTLEAGSQDFIMDGPWREQLLYIGDNIVHNRAAYQLYSNLELIEWQHRLYADGQMPDGIFQPNQPCRTPPDEYRLLDQTILWPIQLEDHWQYTGSKDFIGGLLPNVIKLLNGFQRLYGRDAEGDPRLRNLTGWNWVDHPGILGNGSMRTIRHDGVPTAINILYVMALDSAVRLLRECGGPGDTEEAARLAGLAERLRLSLRTSHWDSGRGLFSDCVVEGAPSPEVSLHVNVLAILAGLADEPRELLERTWGRADVLQPCGVFFHIHLLEVLYRLGMHAELLGEIRKRWGAFLDAGLTTTPENSTINGAWWASVGHPWGASPIIYLVKAVAGLRPLEPGWTRVAVDPFLGDLRKVSVTVPTPQGLIEAAFRQTEHGVAGRIAVPQGIEIEFVDPAASRRIEIG